jgi:hypothetical protein
MLICVCFANARVTSHHATQHRRATSAPQSKKPKPAAIPLKDHITNYLKKNRNKQTAKRTSRNTKVDGRTFIKQKDPYTNLSDSIKNTRKFL